mmetsp:Transcript_137182/g.382651  ORF Transcript_137182/g.382651 Transcript_137182/m.382651 type:complete len:371 (+) Transcript_137182:75-1187(+)
MGCSSSQVNRQAAAPEQFVKDSKFRGIRGDRRSATFASGSQSAAARKKCRGERACTLQPRVSSDSISGSSTASFNDTCDDYGHAYGNEHDNENPTSDAPSEQQQGAGSPAGGDPSVDPCVKRVLDIARQRLPGGKMTSWQKTWCSSEVVGIYLRTSNGDAVQAGECLANALRWREEHAEVLTGEKTPSWQGDMRVLTCGEEGHPIIYVCAAYQPHRPSCTDATDHAAAVLEASTRVMQRGATSVDAVIDCHGFKLANNLDPWPLIKAGLTMKDPYRGRLRKAFIVDAPYAFRFVWSTLCTVINEATRQKVYFVTRQEAVERLASTAGSAAASSVERVMAGNRARTGSVPMRLPSEVEVSSSITQVPAEVR